MRFFEVDVGAGVPVVGLLSEPDHGDAGPLVLHVHGYGGDHYSNAFVRAQHERMPAGGVSYASFALPTSGYVIEQYTDAGVRYVGSALAHPEESLEIVASLVGHFRSQFRTIIVQGHSFGTNLVRELASRHGGLAQGYVFLSAADSEALQCQFDAKATKRDLTDGDPDEIVWNLFGISTRDRVYPIPISRGLFRDLVSGPIFRTWSNPNLDDIEEPKLFIRSKFDSIATAGSLALLHNLGTLRAPTILEIPSESHSFAGHVDRVIEAVQRWLTINELGDV